MKPQTKFIFAVSLSCNFIVICLFIILKLNHGPEEIKYAIPTSDNVLSQYSRPRNRSGYYEDRRDLLKVLPKDNGEIIFIGNSLTQNFELIELFKDLRLKNRGINGDNSAGVLARIKEATKSKPKKIFIEVGINDIMQQIPIDTIYKNYVAIIDVIHNTSPETAIYVQSVFPATPVNTPSAMVKIKEINNRLRQLCKSQNVTYIDLYKSFALGEGINPKYACPDKIHLNGYGYLLWKNLVQGYLN